MRTKNRYQISDFEIEPVFPLSHTTTIIFHITTKFLLFVSNAYFPQPKLREEFLVVLYILYTYMNNIERLIFLIPYQETLFGATLEHE